MTEGAVLGAARAAFFAWLDSAGPDGRIFLQLRIRATGADSYEIRHADDFHLPLESLRAGADAGAPAAIARFTGAGQYRPLRTAPDLRRGWALPGLTRRETWEAVSALYPATVVHWHQEQIGTLPVVPFARTAARQTGIYAGIGQLTGTALQQATTACCSADACLRSARWLPEAGPPSAAVGRGSDATVPCPEACSLFISFAREAVASNLVEARVRFAMPAPARRDLAEMLRTAAAGFANGVPAGELGHALNPRRLRLLAERIEDDSLQASTLATAGEVGPQGAQHTIAVRWGDNAIRIAPEVAAPDQAPGGPAPDTGRRSHASHDDPIQARIVAVATRAALDLVATSTDEAPPAEHLTVRILPAHGAPSARSGVHIRFDLRGTTREGAEVDERLNSILRPFLFRLAEDPDAPAVTWSTGCDPR